MYYSALAPRERKDATHFASASHPSALSERGLSSTSPEDTVGVPFVGIQGGHRELPYMLIPPGLEVAPMQSCHLMRRWALLIILVLLGASLSGCQELFKGPDPTLVDFHNVLTDPVVRIQRLDTDGDEDEKKPEERQREWVVFYQRGGVIFGTVYDVQGDPPVIFPYSCLLYTSPSPRD